MRAIDADTLRERLQSLAYDDWNQGITTSFADACNEIIEIVEEQPTIESRKGKWIKRKGGALGYNCSCCGKSEISNHFDYCPNCGADMRGGKDG